MGPDISTIEESLENALLEFIETLGINQEVISRASEFSIAYEQKFYIQWLKDLNSLLWSLSYHLYNIHAGRTTLKQNYQGRD